MAVEIRGCPKVCGVVYEMASTQVYTGCFVSIAGKY